jgi:hypothetical protein
LLIWCHEWRQGKQDFADLRIDIMPRNRIIVVGEEDYALLINAGLARPTMRWRIPMRQRILTAFAVLSLTAGTASMARAYTTGFVNNAYQSGQYDNFGYGAGDIGVGR